MHAVSPARLDANQAKAATTAPRCPEEIARAAANTRKYGLCRKDLIIANTAEQAEFDELLALHLAEVKPKGSIEQVIFDEMMSAAWNLRRLRRLESALNKDIDPVAALDDDRLQTKLDRLARNQARIERSYYKALKHLSALQTERVLSRSNERTWRYDDATPLLDSRDVRKSPPPRAVAATSPLRR